MLSDQEKQKIVEEERFRLETRRSLSKNDLSSGVNLWVFLNSSFGLWLLSTVVIGLVVNGYGTYQEERSLRLKNLDNLNRLETEIAFRMDKLDYDLSILIDQAKSARDSMDISLNGQGGLDMNTFNSAPKPRQLLSVLDSMFTNADCLDPDTKDRWSVFPEYNNRRLETLLYEAESGFGKNVRVYATGKRAQGWSKLRGDQRTFLLFYATNPLLGKFNGRGDQLRLQFWENWYNKLMQSRSRLREWTGKSVELDG